MNQKEAKELLHLVNEPWVQEGLDRYVEIRIQELYRQFEHATSSVIAGLQGQIYELRQLQNLKERVKERAERKDG